MRFGQDPKRLLGLLRSAGFQWGRATFPLLEGLNSVAHCTFSSDQLSGLRRGWLFATKTSGPKEDAAESIQEDTRIAIEAGLVVFWQVRILKFGVLKNGVGVLRNGVGGVSNGVGVVQDGAHLFGVCTLTWSLELGQNGVTPVQHGLRLEFYSNSILNNSNFVVNNSNSILTNPNSRIRGC